MPVMVDTQILIYALHVPAKKDTQEKRALSLSSQHLLQKNPKACVSVLSVLEVLRGATPDEQKGFTAMLRNLDVRAVLTPIAVRAHELLATRSAKEKVCRKCLNALNATPCGKCEQLISRQQRLNDSLILATAEHAPDVDVLYTNDNGILAMSDLARDVRVEQLPLDADGPLFKPVHSKASKPPATTPER